MLGAEALPLFRQFLLHLANTLLVLYALDGVVSVIDELVDWGWLGVLRSSIASGVLLLCVLTIPVAGLTRRLPPTVFGPIVLSTCCFLLVATQATLANPGVLSPPGLLGAALAQVVIAGFVFWRVRTLRARRGEAGWLFDANAFEGPLFSLPYSVIYVGLSTMAAGAFVAGYLAISFAASAENALAGFLRLDSEGVFLAERQYQRDDQTIRLIGMMHIGEDQAYYALFEDLESATNDTVVLTEGVSDEQGLLADGIDYSALADFLGVDEQGSIEDYVSNGRPTDLSSHTGPDFLNADVDVEEFRPATLEWLALAGAVYTSSTPLTAFIDFYLEARRNPELAALVTDDIIENRNQFAIEMIRQSLADYRVIVVPWGAMHMPGISRAVRTMGFEETTTKYVRLMTWSRVVEAITQPR